MILSGRGSIPMRGVAEIEKLAEQANDGKITGIADISDESDREGMRAVAGLRRDTNPETVLGGLQR